MYSYNIYIIYISTSRSSPLSKVPPCLLSWPSPVLHEPPESTGASGALSGALSASGAWSRSLAPSPSSKFKLNLFYIKALISLN